MRVVQLVVSSPWLLRRVWLWFASMKRFRSVFGSRHELWSLAGVLLLAILVAAMWLAVFARDSTPDARAVRDSSVAAGIAD